MLCIGSGTHFDTQLDAIIWGLLHNTKYIIILSGEHHIILVGILAGVHGPHSAKRSLMKLG